MASACERSRHLLIRPLKLLPAFLLALPVAVSAQSEEDEVVELSVFSVAADETRGYEALTTLGGTRLKTDLRDLATPITAVTAEFLQDTASNNNQDLLTYTTNTEVGGIYGNYGGVGNSQGASDRGQLLKPNDNTRVRGLEQADNTRGFFLTDVPWDSYNTDRIDIQRGPNSILFGVGSPAGIINSSPVVARMDRNGGKVENQLSSHGSHRWVLDYNHVLSEDLLSVRFAALHNDRKFRQEPAFNLDKRFFGTVTFQPQVLPSEWAGRLNVTARFETASIEANNPRFLPPEDGISLWFDNPSGDGVNDPIGLGKAVLDTFIYNQAGGGDPSRNQASDIANPRFIPATNAIDSGPLNNGGVGFFFDNGNDVPFFVSRQAPRVFPGALAADGSVDNAIDYPYGNPMRAGSWNNYARNVNRIDTNSGNPSRFPLADRGYYKDKSLLDHTVFDFYDQLIDGDNKREFQDWDSMNVAIAQTFFNNRIGVEFVYDKQDYNNRRGGSAWQRPYISIDINKNRQDQIPQYSRNDDGLVEIDTYRVPGFTPTAGQPYANPKAGSAITAGSFSSNTSTDRERETKRLTGFAEIRASDLLREDSWLARIIGRHTFTGLLSREERSESEANFNPSATSYAWANSLSVAGEVTNLNEATRGVVPIIYLSEPLFGVNSASGLNLPPVDTYYNPAGSYQADYFKTEWLPSMDPSSPNYVDPGALWLNFIESEGVQADNPGNYTGRTTATLNVLNADAGDFSQLVHNYGVTEQVVDSVGFVWQGHLLDGHIVPTVGWRKDTLETFTGDGAKDDTGIAQTTAVATNKVLDNEGETISWGIVTHVPDRWMENVPVLSGLSAYYNIGENSKVEARYNYDGQPLANPTAESKDYGVVIRAFNDKLSVKVGKYETKVKNGNLPGGVSLIGENQYYIQQLEAWGTANTLLYAFGHAGLDPNQNWHWNWALVDDNAWGNPDYDPDQPTFQNHPSTEAQLAAMDDFVAGMDQQFYDNYAINADVPAIKSAYNTWRTTGDIQPLVDATSSFFTVGTYTTGISSQNDGQINGITPNGTIDNTSEGYEIEVNFRPTSDWNIQLNASKTDAYREGLGQPMSEFIESQYERLQGPAGDIRLWWGGERTIQQFYEDNIISALRFQEESVGSQAPELRPWRFALITNYKFNSDGPFKGLNVGGSYRWQDKQILGYGLKDDQSGLSVDKPIYGESDGRLDLWFGYEQSIGDKVDWRIQLNLRSVGEDVGYTPISANPGGDFATVRITEGMSWSLTNTFKF